MLVMFKVKNFMSFRDEAILDLRATSYVQHPSHLLRVNEKYNLLKTVALYGANASGKSNFISAMYFFEKYIFSQFISNKESDSLDQTKQFRYDLEPFALSKEKDKVSEFDIIFVRNKKQFQYGFECTNESVVSEWYFIDDKKVYERIGSAITYGSKFSGLLSPYSKIPSERLYISVLEYFLEDEAKKTILSDFVDFFRQEYNVYSEILFESTVKGIAGMFGYSTQLLDNRKFREKVEQYLRLIDVGIKRLDIQTETITNDRTGKQEKTKVIRTVHDIFDETGNVVGEQKFDLRQESSGTLRFFAFIQKVIRMTSRGGVFIVDELSARLHPLLTKMIVDIFSSKANTKAQLIFTTHDVSLLNKEQFRRDEIVFIDKNNRGESKLYALSDLKVREDASFSKDYLQGKYGAIPIFNYEITNGGDLNG